MKSQPHEPETGVDALWRPHDGVHTTERAMKVAMGRSLTGLEMDVVYPTFTVSLTLLSVTQLRFEIKEGEIYASDAVLYEPDATATGHQVINEEVETLLAHPPPFVFTAQGPAIGHHGIARLRWASGPPNGPAAVTGMDVAHVVETGRNKPPIQELQDVLGDLPTYDRTSIMTALWTDVKWRLISASAALAMPFAASAQVSTNLERAPTLTIERYSEDWSGLANPANRKGHWTEPFKYVPLSDDRRIYVTTGLEARSRYEGYENVNWGSSPNDDYIWHRLMPYADLHVGKVRFFAQPIVSAITGTDRPKGPVDRTGVDMQQAFVDVEVALPGDASLRVSAGRKLVSLGSGRFIDRRYGTGVPLPFDGFEAILTGKTRQVTGFYLQPVDTRLGNFDDRRSRDKAVWGVYATQWFDATRREGFDVYYIGLRDENAVFDQGAGRQLAHTFGARVFGDNGAWYWNAEAAFQRGTFAGHRSEGWGVGAETGYRFRNSPLRPEIGLTADIVSGDGDPNDPTLGTLNPLFPNGKYFGALSPIGPRNLIHLRPSTAIHPQKDIAISLTGVAYWRESTRDGIYAIPGLLVRSGKNSDARFIGKQIELAASWQATPQLNLTASLSAFAPGPFIRDTGPARTIKMAGAQATFRF